MPRFTYPGEDTRPSHPFQQRIEQLKASGAETIPAEVCLAIATEAVEHIVSAQPGKVKWQHAAGTDRTSFWLQHDTECWLANDLANRMGLRLPAARDLLCDAINQANERHQANTLRF